MAFVPGYQHDVFVSYAHGDDRAWISLLVDGLRSATKKRLGAEANFWIDEDDLRRSRNFSLEIPEGVQTSAVMLVLASPTYTNSEYCVEKECRTYEKALPAKHLRFPAAEFKNELFVFRCLLLPVDNNEHWELFPGATDYRFCDASRTFGQETTAFGTEFQHLVDDLVELLKRMRNQSTPVFLYPAKPTAEIEDAHRALLDELTAQSYRVLPDRYLNLAGQLREAALSIFLLGRAEDERAPELVEIARQEARPWVVWRSPAAAASDSPGQRAFSRILEQTDSVSKTYLNEKITVAKLKEQVLSTLRPDGLALAATDGKQRIYVIFDPRADDDISSAGMIQYHYRENFNFEFSNDPRQHSKRLTQSDGVLLVWGDADEDWCSHEFEEMQRLARSAKARGLCLFDPKEEKNAAVELIRGQARDLYVAEQFGPKFDPGRLSHFFEKLL